MQTKQIKVHVMHADPVMSAGLMAILSASNDFILSSHSQHPQSQSQAELIITDYHGGLTSCRGMVADRYGKPARILIVTQFDKEWEVRTAMDSGAHGYLLQGCAPE